MMRGALLIRLNPRKAFRGLGAALAVIALHAMVASRCAADDSAAKTPPPKTTSNQPAAKPPRLTPAQHDAAALAFARENHPELAELIAKLRRENPHQFDRALRELSRDYDRLTRIKQLAPTQYELSLAAWKLDSRAHLLAARMTISQDPALEGELKQVLRERIDVRLKQLDSERGRLQDRLAQIKKSMDAIEDKEAAADKDLQRIKRSVARNRRPAKKPAVHDANAAGASPVVAERPHVPVDKTAASATPPWAGPGASGKTKTD